MEIINHTEPIGDSQHSANLISAGCSRMVTVTVY